MEFATTPAQVWAFVEPQEGVAVYRNETSWETTTKIRVALGWVREGDPVSMYWDLNG